jgi:type II secretory pathway predicted ATPase ExeA
MYETRFGLLCRPFPATPDTACYYPATGHQRVLASLRSAVADGQAIALLTGEPGTGKTLLGHLLLEDLAHDLVPALLSNTHFADRSALLQAILFDLSLSYRGESEQELRLRLTDFLLTIFQAGKRALVVVDEAHLLSDDLLEELRLLGNLEAGQCRALTVVLLAQPRMLETLKKPDLTAFQQRVETRASIGSLDVEEAADYVLHHLRRAGVRPEALISDEALEMLARHTRGVPRLLNQAARRALALADAAEAAYVDAEAALEALTAIGVEVPAPVTSATLGPIGEHDLDDEPNGSYRLFDAPRRVL